MHRNCYFNSPTYLNPTYQFKNREDLFFAGQMTGVEGYVESAQSGIVAGKNMVRYLKEKNFLLILEKQSWALWLTILRMRPQVISSR